MIISRYFSSCLASKPAFYFARVHFVIDRELGDYADFSIKSDSDEAARKAAIDLLLDLVVEGEITSVERVELTPVASRRVWDAEASGNKIGRMGEIFR